MKRIKSNVKFVFLEPYKYYINEEKRSITCVMEGFILDRVTYNGSLNTLSFKATVKCSPDDEFDVVKGKRLAESRCKKKIYKYMHDYVYREYKKYSNLAVQYLHDVTTYASYIARENSHFKELDEK